MKYLPLSLLMVAAAAVAAPTFAERKAPSEPAKIYQVGARVVQRF